MLEALLITGVKRPVLRVFLKQNQHVRNRWSQRHFLTFCLQVYSHLLQDDGVSPFRCLSEEWKQESSFHIKSNICEASIKDNVQFHLEHFQSLTFIP